VGESGIQGPLSLGDHVGRGLEIGFTDFEVDDVASLGFQRPGPSQNLEGSLGSQSIHRTRKLH